MTWQHEGPRHIRLLADHAGGNITDYHEWVYLGEEERRDALARKNNNGTTSWLVLRCNNPGCEARLLVREDEMVEWATQAFQGNARTDDDV